MAKVLFYTATAAQFNSLTTKDENALYFITDTGELFKGAVRYSFPVKQVTAFPESGENGVIYVSNAGEAKIWAGSSYIILGSNVVENFLAAAVRHEVTAEEAGTGIYSSMAEGDLGIQFTMQTGEQLFVRLTDLVDTYVADNTATKGVTVTVDGYKISAEVTVSTEADNRLTIKDDGVYVEPLQWQTVAD